ncbi:LysR substrate-binding domain-containing protein [Amnibacterium kyonggiense]
MPDPFVLGVVPGVTPDRWVRVWRERMPEVPLRIVPVDDAPAALRTGVTMVFARLPIDDPTAHVIPLWEETPVVVAAKDHPVRLFDAVTEADLADEELYPGWDDAVLDVVAAGHGIARMPQSVFRATGRRDVVARPIADAAPTRIGLVWLRDSGGPLVDEFIGVVRGRTANSSRGTAPEPAAAPTKRPARPAKTGRERLGKRPRRR